MARNFKELQAKLYCRCAREKVIANGHWATCHAYAGASNP